MPPARPQPTAAQTAAVQAVLHGAADRAARVPAQDCPYDVRGAAADRFLARYWLKGWNRAHR